MALGLLGRKKGMTQIFTDQGEVVPVTVVQAGPCTIIQKRTKEKEGYNAIQVGFEIEKKMNRLNKPEKNHFEKKKLECFKMLKEFRVGSLENLEVGQVMDVKLFQIGEQVNVQGVTKGRGFQGVMKRHGKHGGPDAHGSDFHRRPGSIGMRTEPGRVLKNMKMPGRMGHDQVMIRKLTVAGVRPEENALLLRGAVPGARESLVVIYKRTRDQGPETRDQKQEKSS